MDRTRYLGIYYREVKTKALKSVCFLVDRIQVRALHSSVIFTFYSRARDSGPGWEPRNRAPVTHASTPRQTQ
jgi:hypothetical protein